MKRIFLTFMLTLTPGLTYASFIDQHLAECRSGIAQSCYDAANLYQTGLEVSENPVKAFSLYKEACRLNHGKACSRMGFIYNRRGIYSESANYYRKACELKEKSTCMALGLYYRDGKGGLSPSMTAYRNYLNADCINGWQPACQEIKKLDRLHH